MEEHLDIYGTAAKHIHFYGEEATSRAAHRANALSEKGDRIGATAWQLVVRAIEELQRDKARVAVLLEPRGDYQPLWHGSYEYSVSRSFAGTWRWELHPHEADATIALRGETGDRGTREDAVKAAQDAIDAQIRKWKGA